MPNCNCRTEDRLLLLYQTKLQDTSLFIYQYIRSSISKFGFKVMTERNGELREQLRPCFHDLFRTFRGTVGVLAGLLKPLGTFSMTEEEFWARLQSFMLRHAYIHEAVFTGPEATNRRAGVQVIRSAWTEFLYISTSVNAAKETFGNTVSSPLPHETVQLSHNIVEAETRKVINVAI